MTTVVYDQELEDPPEALEKVRKCLRCRDEFTSRWLGERVCKRCKTHSFWRESGAVFEL